MKKLLVLLLVVYYSIPLSAQIRYDDYKTLLKEKKKMARMFKRSACGNFEGMYDFLFIESMEFRLRPKKENFTSSWIAENSFFPNKTKKSTLSYFEVIMFDKNQNILGTIRNDRFYCFNEYGRHDQILTMVLNFVMDQSIDKISIINPTPGKIFFCQKDEEIIVLKFENGNMKVLNLYEFIDCCWDEQFPNEIMKIKYQD